MAVVLREFLYAADGHTVTRMTLGMEGDFASSHLGLLAEGFIGDPEPVPIEMPEKEAPPSASRPARGRRASENISSGDDAGA